MVIQDYTDRAGFKRQVQLPRPDANPEYGMVLSIDVKALAALLELTTPQALALNTLLWDNNLKWPSDFSGPVFSPVVNIFKQLEGLTPDEAKRLGNSLIQIIRKQHNGQ